MFKIFRKKPNVDASITEARRLISLGKQKEAIDIYDKLVRAYPESAVVYADRGTALAMAGKIVMAIEDLKKAISLGFDHSSVYTSLATAQMQAGDVKCSIANFGAAAALDKNNAFIYYNRATLLVRTGDHESARRDLEYCLQLGLDVEFEAAVRNKLNALPAK